MTLFLIGGRRNWLGSGFATVTGLVDVALLEEEALALVDGCILVLVLSIEVAIVQKVALVRTGKVVLEVKVEDIHNVVQVSGAGVATTQAVINGRVCRS